MAGTWRPGTGYLELRTRGSSNPFRFRSDLGFRRVARLVEVGRRDAHCRFSSYIARHGHLAREPELAEDLPGLETLLLGGSHGFGLALLECDPTRGALRVSAAAVQYIDAEILLYGEDEALAFWDFGGLTSNGDDGHVGSFRGEWCRLGRHHQGDDVIHHQARQADEGEQREFQGPAIPAQRPDAEYNDTADHHLEQAGQHQVGVEQ